MLKFLKKMLARVESGKASAGIFVDGVPYNSFLKEEYTKYLISYSTKISNILAGKQLAWLDSFFMCPPGFPFIEVSFVVEKKVFPLKPEGDGFKAVRLDFFIPKKETYEGTITIGEYKIKIGCNGAFVAAWVNGEKTPKIKTKKGCFSISILRTPIAKLIWISGEGHTLILSDWISDWPSYSLEINSKEGRLGIVGFQEWSSCHANFAFPPEGDGESLTLKSAPYFVREWEERSRKLWHISIALRVCADYVLNSNENDKKQVNVDSLFLMAELVSCAIGNFTHWRPSSAQEAGVSEWERGNWASGFLCGAYGISTALLKDLGNQVSSAKAKNIALEKGAKWLVRDPRTPYTAIDFPPVAHWLRRSTNHGIVILASALVGLEEIRRISPGTDISVALERLKKDFWQLLNDSFKNGIYLEGIRYAQFSLQEAIAYLIYDYRKTGEEWETYHSANFPDLPLVKDFITAAVYPGSEIPLASWGDCPILPWKRSVINFLDSVEGPDKANIHNQIFFKREGVKLLKNNTSEILKTEPLTLPTLLLPKVGNVTVKQTSIVVKQFSNSIAAIRGKIGDAPYPDWHLYITATPIHLTHNKDHDLGSFFWAANGKILIGEAPGRAAYCHNMAGIKGIMLDDIEDPYRCYGSEQGGSLTDRGYGGELSVTRIESEVFIVGIVAKDGIAYSNNKPLIRNYRRDFVILNSLEPIVIVITRGEVQETEKNVFVNFVCPNGANVEIMAGTKKQCSLGNSNATLSVISVDESSLHVRPMENFTGSRIIEDLPRDMHFCSVAVLESCVKKGAYKLKTANNERVIYCCTPNNKKYQIHVPNNKSEIKVVSEGNNYDF